MKSTRKSAREVPTTDVKAQLDGFIDKFDVSTARLIRRCREKLRKMFPNATELVYDNYNFFVIGYSPTERPSDTVVSLAAAANGVGLSFYRGATIPDPSHLLQGSGTQNRFIRLPDANILDDVRVRRLIASAVSRANAPFAPDAKGKTIIRSISTKQRPRRKGPAPRP